MGSSGYGNFGNYQILNGNEEKNQCPESIEYMKIEDVDTSEYYLLNNGCPAKGSSVEIAAKLSNGRLVLLDSITNKIVGNIPTDFNNLIVCINLGYIYTGVVIGTGNTPFPYVTVKLDGTK